METDRQGSSRSILQRWVLATVVGWIVGVVVVVVLTGLDEFIHIGGESWVGIGMGGVVGYFQWRVARKWFSVSQQWIWASCTGLAVPFVVQDLLQSFVLKGPLFQGGTEYLGLCLLTACGSLLAGLWQHQLLRSQTRRAIWWVAASVAGWLLAAVGINTVSIPGRPETAIGMIVNLGTLPLGGLIHGLVTGGSLLVILSRKGEPERLESPALHGSR